MVLNARPANGSFGSGLRSVVSLSLFFGIGPLTGGRSAGGPANGRNRRWAVAAERSGEVG